MSDTVLPQSLPDYAELFCMSNFSFLRGASHAEELAARAAQLGYKALAITDECSLAGVVRAHAEAKRAGLPFIVGAHFHLQRRDASPGPSFIALAQNREGYGNLSECITLGRRRVEKGRYLLYPEDLETGALAGLPGCLLIGLPPYPGVTEAESARMEADAAWLARHFPGRAWLGLNLLLRAWDDAHRDAVEDTARRHGLPVVAIGGVLMHVRSRKPLQDVLTAIRLNTPVAECGYALSPNAEEHLRARLRLANIYPPASLAETLRIAAECRFSLDELRYEYPDELVPAGETATSYLRKETYIGAHRRFRDGIPAQVQAQIEHELSLIADMRYEPYFLTVYDIVRFARSRGILCQGRGSAANSAVCYCLGVTEVDPARANLLFERFISKERAEPPDIDVDFEHQRREEVIQYIYQKYGRQRAALAATVISYRPKSALRDSGKALGIDPAIIDKVAKAQHWFDSKHELLQRFAEVGLDPDAELSQQWAGMARTLLGFPRHLSQHVGGFVIARDKLSRLVPIENAAMAERSVIQWDKDDLEELGLLKVDILALGMLSAIRRALELVSAWRGLEFCLQDIPPEDPATYDMICRADTVGVFQIESRAQMSMLPRMKPRTFYDLVIEVAIVRPGPIQGGMVHPYLRRREGRDPEHYPTPEMQQALGRTLGVPIFQEQVMQVVMLAAGFTPGEADQLRRAMAAWNRKGGLDKYGPRIIAGMLERGYAREFAEAIVRQIQGFGEYGFPESHAASFALLAYASAWLKCHEPAAFVCALLNSLPMGFYSAGQLVRDAQAHAISVLPVDVRISDWECKLEAADGPQPAVRLGMNVLRGMRAEAAQRIEEVRAIRPFSDTTDLARRAGLERHDLQVLAAANALSGLAGHRRQALWEAVAAVPDKDLLRPAGVQDDTPALAAPSEGDEIVSDYRAQGMSLGRHPLALLRPALQAKRFLRAADLMDFQDGQLARAAGIVTVRQRPGTAKGVLFMTLEDESGNVNVIIWPKLVEKQRREVLSASLLGIYGIWQRVGEVRHLVAKRLVDLSPMLGRLSPASRNFH
ncbi:error-prone DNA polymerase [Massilia sp. TS11]|uniref:error-prone DNA polymerase n=1 Tax=Massilia sp. TS11 TaxID=2908003 RepID=UPI001EDC4F72|nr:error-prone DNA polymerase [Massilia sp. TS11]MCG2582943.1 error-prone DNA polymerase [Massilia sp. TS11]